MRPTRTVLLAGFEPFGGSRVNASEESVRALEGRKIKGRRVVIEILPVRFDTATDLLRARIRAVRPELVICVGEASGRSDITVERIAINVNDARIPDNAGAQPIDRAIRAKGPAAYWSTLPIKAIVAALVRADIPASVSQTAGTFVCNNVFYGLMRHLARRSGTRGGFIHVPCLSEETTHVGTSMSSDQIAHALEIAITTSLETKLDARLSGGAEQ